MKQIVIHFIALIVAFASGVCVSSLCSAIRWSGEIHPLIEASKSTAPILVTVPSPSSAPNLEATKDVGWEVVSREFNKVSRRFRFSITGKYPVIRLASNARARRLNQEIQRTIVARYRYMTAPNPKDLRDQIRAYPGEDILETAEFDYQLMGSAKSVLSIRFHETTYSRGSAHPLQGYFTVNYAMDSGKILGIRDVFAPKFDYLQFLSKFCAESIGVMEPWKDAVSPRLSNFKSWNITEESLLINFDRCEVSACVDGARTVVIPFKEFSAHINKRSLAF